MAPRGKKKNEKMGKVRVREIPRLAAITYFRLFAGKYIFFLAPTEAQGVAIFICLSFRLSGPSLSEALNLHLLGSDSIRVYPESHS